VVYSETCIKRNLGMMEAFLKWKHFTVRVIWGPTNPYLKYTYQKRHFCKRDSVCEDTYCGTRGTVSVRIPTVAQEGQCL